MADFETYCDGTENNSLHIVGVGNNTEMIMNIQNMILMLSIMLTM